ncbi:MAG: peptidoglycan-binding domain-containing protein, partial [Candidatus Micrarchaeia archaeon]
MADDSRKIIPVPAAAKLTEEQREYFEKIKDGLLKDLLIDLDYVGKKWREEGWQGGENGLTDDRKKKPHRKNASTNDIKTAQKILNSLMAENLPPDIRLKGPPLKEDGIYGKATQEKVKEFQRMINTYLKKYNTGIWVNPSDKDIALVNSLKCRGKLYNAAPNLFIEKRKGITYETTMQNYTPDKSKRNGIVIIKDEQGYEIGRIRIFVDKKNNITIDGVYLKEILVDGYFGEETRKALLFLMGVLTAKEEKPVPVEHAQRIEIGVSFQPSIYSLFSRNQILSKKLKDDLEAAGKYNVETLKIIKGIILRLNYEDEIKLRNDKTITIGGRTYQNSFEGITKAMLDGNSADKVYDAFAGKLRSLGIDIAEYERELGFNKGVNWYRSEPGRKKYCELANYADKITPRMEPFVKVKETPSSDKGGLVLDYSGVDDVFARALRNIEKYLPRDSLFTNLVLADVYEKRSRVAQIIKAAEKEGKSEKEILDLLNKNNELRSLVFNAFKMYGDALFKSNYFDAIGLEINKPALFQQAVSKLVESTTKETGLKELCENFSINPSSTKQEFAESFYKEIKMDITSAADIRKLRENP